MGNVLSKKTGNGQVAPSDSQLKPTKSMEAFTTISYAIDKQNAKIAQLYKETTGDKKVEITFLGEEYEFYKLKSTAIQKVTERVLKCVHDFKPSALLEKIGFDAQSLSFEHAIANTTADTSETKQLDDSLKILLFKMSVSEFQLGQCSVKKYSELSSKIETPLSDILKNTVKESLTGQKSTESIRFNYDACRMRLKKATVEKTRERIQIECDTLKKSLDDSAASTLSKMKAVTESTALGSALLALIKIQEEYHRVSAAAMFELLPEAEELYSQHRQALESAKSAFSSAAAPSAADVLGAPSPLVEASAESPSLVEASAESPSSVEAFAASPSSVEAFAASPSSVEAFAESSSSVEAFVATTSAAEGSAPTPSSVEMSQVSDKPEVSLQMQEI